VRSTFLHDHHPPTDPDGGDDARDRTNRLLATRDVAPSRRGRIDEEEG
jgi:hypothetical protein